MPNPPLFYRPSGATVCATNVSDKNTGELDFNSQVTATRYQKTS